MPLRASRLIMRTPKLLTLSLLPAALTGFLYSAFSYVFYQWVLGAVPAWLQTLGMNPQGFMLHVFQVGAVLFALLVTALTYSIAASLVALPLNDVLALATENYTHTQLSPVMGGGLIQFTRLMLIDAAKNFAALFLTLFALLVSWVPVLNFLSFIVAVSLVTFQYVSYPQTRRGENLIDGFKFLIRNAPASLGFGLAHLLLFAVPLLSLVILPVAVVGGTLLYAHCKRTSLDHSA